MRIRVYVSDIKEKTISVKTFDDAKAFLFEEWIAWCGLFPKPETLSRFVETGSVKCYTNGMVKEWFIVNKGID